MSTRTSWSEIKRRRLTKPDAHAGYENARLAYELGRRIRELREAQGLSQRQLADRMGTTQSVIARLEAGGSKPSMTTLERIAAALGTAIDIRFKEPGAAG